MYAAYWGLRRAPFQNTLDDAWFFDGPGHEEALCRLLYLVEEKRTCGLLRGPSGTGKSLLMKLAARHGRRSTRLVAEVDLACADGPEILWRLTSQLGLGPKRNDSPARLWRSLDDHLVGARLVRRQTVFFFDHADQSFPECGPVLERLLHLAHRASGALTVLMAMREGELPAWCEGPTRFATLRIDLDPLNARQTAQFVASALRSAGCERDLFAPRALAAIYEESRGVPRTVNRLCELSLLAAMHDQQDVVDPQTVHGVAAELQL